MGSGSACTERTGTSRSCLSRAMNRCRTDGLDASAVQEVFIGAGRSDAILAWHADIPGGRLVARASPALSPPCRFSPSPTTCMSASPSGIRRNQEWWWPLVSWSGFDSFGLGRGTFERTAAVVPELCATQAALSGRPRWPSHLGDPRGPDVGAALGGVDAARASGARRSSRYDAASACRTIRRSKEGPCERSTPTIWW